MKPIAPKIGKLQLEFCSTHPIDSCPYFPDKPQVLPADEYMMRKELFPIARRRSTSTNVDSYADLLEIMQHIDSMKHVLPCDENDAAALANYDYALTYDEEHLFRC